MLSTGLQILSKKTLWLVVGYIELSRFRCGQTWLPNEPQVRSGGWGERSHTTELSQSATSAQHSAVQVVSDQNVPPPVFLTKSSDLKTQLQRSAARWAGVGTGEGGSRTSGGRLSFRWDSHQDDDDRWRSVMIKPFMLRRFWQQTDICSVLMYQVPKF